MNPNPPRSASTYGRVGGETSLKKDYAVNTSVRFERVSREPSRPKSAPIVSDSTFSLQQLVYDRTAINRPQLAPSLLATLRARTRATSAMTVSNAPTNYSFGNTAATPRLRSARGRPSPRLTYDFTRRVTETDELIAGPKSERMPAEMAKGTFFKMSDERKAFGRAIKELDVKRDFRSHANEIEVNLLEQLREARARPEPPCPIRMMIFRNLFDQLIAHDIVYGPLLAQIKHEYEVTLNPLESDSMKKLYDESLLENDRLRETISSNGKEFKRLQDEMHLLSKENGRLRVALEQKSEQLEELTRTLMQSNPNFARQMANQNRIRELEGEHPESGSGSGSGSSSAPGISGDELLAFEKENEEMFNVFESLNEEMRSMERKVVEIVSLNNLFASEVMSQARDIDHLHDSAISTADAISRGNTELRKASNQGASFRIFLLIFLLTASFSLLFLHFITL
eukprot:comp20179_c0_seq2/m.39896 comp20179_c0_seq2/g.39896  ORF comp20179_c0_seq2/g.39896 comp20179_c0_seq2/m.39896 type:complete len:455 (+) comp20179_c0_seq2:2-1366(+)